MHTVARWLLEARGVAVQTEWLEACVRWIHNEEGTGDGVSEERLQELVYGQWLHADLQVTVDPGQACVPPAVLQNQSCHISGTFIVQVNSVLDIGLPAYAQLQKLKGQAIDPPDTPHKKNTAGEARPSRLLLLSLTDGVTVFQAMEYQPIPCLNTQLYPGVKLALHGSIDCRLGTLLLRPEHVQLLGGRVEQICETGRQMRLLARMLNDESLAEQPASHRPISAAGGPTDQQPSLPPSSGSHDVSSHTGSGSHDPHSYGISRSHEQHPPPLRSHNSHSYPASRSHEQHPPPSRSHDPHSYPASRSHEQHPPPLRSHDQGPNHAEVERTMQQECNDFSVAELEELEEELAREAEEGEDPPFGDANGEDPPFGDANEEDLAALTHLENDFDGGQEAGFSEEDLLADEYDDYGFEELNDDSPPTAAVSVSGVHPPSAISTGIGCPTLDYNATLDHNRDDVETHVAPTAHSHGRSSHLRLSIKSKQRPSANKPNGSVERHQYCDEKTSKRLPVASVRPLTCEGQTLLTSSIPESPSGSGEEEEEGEREEEERETVLLLPSLAHVAEHLAQSSAAVKVKAHVVRVADRLTHSTGVWMVAVVIGDDDSGVELRVNLSNEILEKLLGFSAVEFGDRIVPFKADKTIKAKASKAFAFCQSALADFNCFMVIRSSHTHCHPLVVQLLDS